MGWFLVGEGVEHGRGLYRKDVGEKRVVRSDGCADLDGYGGGGGCLLRKRIGLLFYLLFLFVIESLYLDATFVFSLSFPGVCSALLE